MAVFMIVFVSWSVVLRIDGVEVLLLLLSPSSLQHRSSEVF